MNYNKIRLPDGDGTVESTMRLQKFTKFGRKVISRSVSSIQLGLNR